MYRYANAICFNFDKVKFDLSLEDKSAPKIDEKINPTDFRFENEMDLTAMFTGPPYRSFSWHLLLDLRANRRFP
jgi:hypothetical protein